MTVKKKQMMMIDDGGEDKSKITKRKYKSQAGTNIVKPKKQKKAEQTNAVL